MKIDFFLSSPQGDIPADPKILASPFLLSPTAHHPFLLLGNYFATLKKFALASPELAGVETIKILSEKHGALYHIASLTADWQGEIKKYSLSSAISEVGKKCLKRDFELIDRLNNSLGLPFLPAVYSSALLPCGSPPASVDLFLVLAEWFADHHEWHLTEDGQDIKLWDHSRGNRILGQQAAREIFKKTAEILTSYYDTATASQIYPWHHAAGDFIVCEQNGAIQVRLTTVRDYQALALPGATSAESPFVALLFFFLHLTIRNRLDRIEGVAAPVWAGTFVVPATVAGFFTAMHAKTTRNQVSGGTAEQVLGLLKTCNPDELAAMYSPLLNYYCEENPDEAGFIASHLEEHCQTLHREINKFSLKP